MSCDFSLHLSSLLPSTSFFPSPVHSFLSPFLFFHPSTIYFLILSLFSLSTLSSLPSFFLSSIHPSNPLPLFLSSIHPFYPHPSPFPPSSLLIHTLPPFRSPTLSVILFYFFLFLFIIASTESSTEPQHNLSLHKVFTQSSIPVHSVEIHGCQSSLTPSLGEALRGISLVVHRMDH